MKHWWILFLALPAFAAKPEKTMLGAKLAEVKPPSMTIIVGVNSVAGGVAAPGWPIIVSAATDDDKPVPANLNIKVTDDKDKEVPVAFERTKDFWIASESALPPGRYHITLVPAGDAQIESADLRVESADDDLLGLLKIQRALLTGKDDEALAEADRLKTEDAWIAKGDILMGRDLPDEALDAYDKAFEMQSPKAGENLPLHERRHAAFFRSLEKRGVLTPAQSQ